MLLLSSSVWLLCGLCQSALFTSKICPIFRLSLPLLGVFNKPLFELENVRLQRYREKLIEYNFDLCWSAGKDHLIADDLSRAPVFAADDCAMVVSVMAVTSDDPALNFIMDCAKDQDYVQGVDAFKRGLLPKHNTFLRPIASVWNNLSLHEDLPLICLQGGLVVPDSARPTLLDLLHVPHSGEVNTYQNARQLYFWPHMKNEIHNRVAGCEACHRHLLSLPAEPFVLTSAAEPMEALGVDLFDF